MDHMKVKLTEIYENLTEIYEELEEIVVDVNMIDAILYIILLIISCSIWLNLTGENSVKSIFPNCCNSVCSFCNLNDCWGVCQCSRCIQCLYKFKYDPWQI